MAAIQAAEPLLAEFHRALSSAMAGALTNDKIAALNALAYKVMRCDDVIVTKDDVRKGKATPSVECELSTVFP